MRGTAKRAAKVPVNGTAKAARPAAARVAKTVTRMAAARPATAPEIAAFRRRVLAWYARDQRALPWRRTRDPYAIWISEIMLQQTRVDAVIPYYERFLARFPAVVDLAQAPVDAVLQLWAGLGYYSRARNLHAAAQAIVTGHAGVFPRDPEALRALPGIGRYTAGAIASIAFGLPAPVVDGNVTRVFARWFCDGGDVQSPAVVKRMWERAGDWARCAAPGDANQALMELGALVCIKPLPACERCPVQSLCAAYQAGCAAALPRPKRRATPQRVQLDVLLAEHAERLLLVRRTAGTLLRGWWEAPSAYGRNSVQRKQREQREQRVQRMPRVPLSGARAPRLRAPVATSNAPSPEVLGQTASRFQFTPGVAQRIGATRHGILQHHLHVTVWHTPVHAPPQNARAAKAVPRGAVEREPGEPSTALANLNLEGLETRWVTSHECRDLPLATLTRKVLREAARHDPRWATFLPSRA